MMLSVIIPVYNVGKWIDRCVESVVNQTYKKLEILLIDDGSTDDSGDKCDVWAQKDSRIRVIHKENGGLSDARNVGVSLVKGDYISFIDSDDWIDLDMYDDMMKQAERENGDIVICRFMKNNIEEVFSGRSVCLTSDEVLHAYFDVNSIYKISTSVWTKIYRTTIVREVKFPTGKRYEDIFYTPFVLSQAKKIIYIDKPYYHYFFNRNDSIMNQKIDDKLFTDEIPLNNQLNNWLKCNEWMDLYYLATSKFALRLIDCYMAFWNNKDHRRKKVYEEVMKINKKKMKAQKRRDSLRLLLFRFSPEVYAFIVSKYLRWRRKCVKMFF